MELAKAVLRRDRKASAEFVQLYSDPLYRYIRFRLQPRLESVEDLVQEVFLTAWKSLDKYQGASPLRVWLLGIARHKVQDHYRQILKSVPFPDDAEELKSDDEPLEALLATRQAQERVSAILVQLPEDYRTALLWRYWAKSRVRFNRLLAMRGVPRLLLAISKAASSSIGVAKMPMSIVPAFKAVIICIVVISRMKILSLGAALANSFRNSGTR